ncbi:MAG: MFS transporter [Saprospiraceae bacterium]|jgi:putative MFS transporter|nr:MFS transporter [Saprospiraceae bacterium]MBP9209154.1 MFS transporter [Saprospiraceae bacterium]MBV6473615.1 putative niacin/nicotinamide transporter NaiP [Saprospiraceae bacterium]
MNLQHRTPTSKILTIPVLVAALGYFVDIYDLQLFNIVGRESLEKGLKLSPDQTARYDYLLFLWQMGGMLLGGVVFGVLGDKLGRKSVLFSSILIYSLANIANAFVTDITTYKVVRLIAGFGLSGELGAAITLVSEVIERERRGWGTMIIVSAGVLGAVAANLIARLTEWQISYIIGGVLGLVLLGFRVGTFESGMFTSLQKTAVQKGNFFMLFKGKAIFKKYLASILVGLPVWFVIGILIKFSDKYGVLLGIQERVSVADSIMYAYIGLSVGDLLSGWLSQVWRSRRKVIFSYLIFTGLLTFVYLYAKGIGLTAFYSLTFLLGLAAGFWALFVSMAAEQFGTNIRATVTTTVPNFVRGAVIPITLSFNYLLGYLGIEGATWIVGGGCILLSGLSTWSLSETFARDLDYYETS